MKDWNTFDYLAFLLSAVTYYYYVRLTLKSKTRPTMSTWVSWCLMDAVVLGGMMFKHTVSLQLLAYFVGSGCVIAASIYAKASLGWKWYDIVCLAIVIVAAALSALTTIPDFAIGLGLAAMVVGSWPLLRNAWHNPEHEPLQAWLFNLAGAIAAVLAVEQWSWDEASKPLFLVLSILFNIVIARQLLPSCNKLIHQALMRDLD